MDRNSFIGMTLIMLLLFGWLFYMSVSEAPKPPKDTVADTTAHQLPAKAQDSLAPVKSVADSFQTQQRYGIFSQFASQNETIYTIENDLFVAEISSRGAVLKSWKLKKYKKWDKTPVQLIRRGNGELYINFVTLDAKKIDTRDLNFSLANQSSTNIKIQGNQSANLVFELDLGNNRKIKKVLKFFGDKYHIEQNITVANLEDVLPTRGYNLVWEKGLPPQEYNSVDEASDAMAIVQMNGEVEEVNATETKPTEKSFTGIIDYAAIKTKYFATSIMPQPWQSFDGTVDISGYARHHAKNGITETYSINYRIPYKGGEQHNNFKIFIGPLEYNIVRSYGMNALINFGWRFLIRPIGEHFMLPIFQFVHKFVPNYGIAILIFSLIIKLLLHPLSITQMRSAQKMQLLSPEMEKIRTKYKDDQQAQQKEIMKLYSEYGINPASGCLPLLLQMPILFALWAVLRSAIELRQEPFIWWITDLSMPDKILNFGFSFLGISHLSGLAVLMGVTMFIQQKMTITDPRQKAMVYMMPVMFLFLFSNFPSGLNLYYFFFNLLSIAQQIYINKFSKKRLTLEDLKKMPKKEGWLQRKMREAQELAEAQGRTLPGAKPQHSNRPNQNRPKRKK